MTCFRIILLLVLISLPQAAKATGSAWAKSDFLSARLVSQYNAVGQSESLLAGLELKLEEGWYTYWRMAGDAGKAPEMDWSESYNVQSVEVGWPIPQRFDTFGLNSFGYTDVVLFPVTVTPQAAGEAVRLSLKLDAVVCHDICVPQTLNVLLDIPEGKAARSERAFALEAAQKALPAKGDTPALKLETAVLGSEALVITAWARDGFDNPDMLVEAPDDILTRPPEITIDNKEVRRAMFRIPAPEGIGDLTQELLGKSVTVTFVNRGEAMEREFGF